jgi:hypothetical protein
MATFKMPLSGDVVQSINPWTAFFSPIGNQLGVININLGQSSAPDVEQEILSDVGTYGRQIGRIGDALIVLLAHFHPIAVDSRGNGRDRRAQENAQRGRRREAEARTAGAAAPRRKGIGGVASSTAKPRMLRGVRCAALMTGASFAEIGNARPPPPEERRLVVKRQLQQFVEQGHVNEAVKLKTSGRALPEVFGGLTV